MHMSRKWSGTDADLEGCSCPILPCGFVDTNVANELDCHQHAYRYFKTMRRWHPDDKCPGPATTFGARNAYPD